MASTDPAVFNRVCGPIFAATADPADRRFSAQVKVSARMLSVFATFSRQIRRIGSAGDGGHPSVILLFSRNGPVSLRVGGSVHPLDVAIISEETDFSVRPDQPDGTGAVGCITLRFAPALAARMPRTPILLQAAAGEVRDRRVVQIRQLGERLIDGAPRPATGDAGDGDGEVEQITRLIGDQLDFGEWAQPFPPQAGGAAGGRDIVAAVQRYLGRHACDADLTPARLARHCAVSVRKLYNAFAAADMSLRATILSYRLEEARRQLHARTVKKVTSIAYDTGFRDVSTFYRNFRREFGFSPRHNGDMADDSAGGKTAFPKTAFPKTVFSETACPECAAAEVEGDVILSRAAGRNPRPYLLAIADPARPCRLHDGQAESSRLPQDTLFRHHAPRGRRLMQIPRGHGRRS